VYNNDGTPLTKKYTINVNDDINGRYSLGHKLHVNAYSAPLLSEPQNITTIEKKLIEDKVTDYCTKCFSDSFMSFDTFYFQYHAGSCLLGKGGDVFYVYFLNTCAWLCDKTNYQTIVLKHGLINIQITKHLPASL
jgi:hypothetical protein